VKNQPNTLLTKFYGMYRVKTHQRNAIYFVVMGSVFYTDLEIHRIYDLKGSTHGRAATEKEKRMDTPVLKDLDFIENDERIRIGKVKCKLFCEQLRRDTELLRKLKIMDYSLLLGIHYANRANDGGASPPMEDVATPDLANGQSPDIDGAATNQHPLSDENLKAHNAQIATETQCEAKVSELQIVNPERMEASNSKNIEPAQSTTVESKTPSFALQSSPKSIPSTAPVVDERPEDERQRGAAAADEEEEKGRLSPVAAEPKESAVTALSSAEKPKRDLGPPGFASLSRVPSRRTSQITSSAHHSRYAIKTPIELNFDMPELVDVRRMDRFEDPADDDHDGNIFCQDQGGMQMMLEDGKEGECIYFCGIIDVLQKYNKRKKVENFFRGLQPKTDVATISAVPPEQYSMRMYEFLTPRVH